MLVTQRVSGIKIAACKLPGRPSSRSETTSLFRPRNEQSRWISRTLVRKNCVQSALVGGGQGASRAPLRRAYCRQENAGPALSVSLALTAVGDYELGAPRVQEHVRVPHRDRAHQPPLRQRRSPDGTVHPVPAQRTRIDPSGSIQVAHVQSRTFRGPSSKGGHAEEERGSTRTCQVQHRHRHHPPSRACPSPACSSSRCPA